MITAMNEKTTGYPIKHIMHCRDVPAQRDSIIHRRNPIWNSSRLEYTYPNGYVEGLALNYHLQRGSAARA